MCFLTSYSAKIVLLMLSIWSLMMVISLYLVTKTSGGVYFKSIDSKIYNNPNNSKEKTSSYVPMYLKKQNTLKSIHDEMMISNIPLVYWIKRWEKKDHKKKNCSNFPTLLDLEFNNIYWQMMPSTNGTFYLLNAYYDKRNLSSNSSAVRILGMIDRFQPTLKTFCQLWYENITQPVFAEVHYTYIWYKQWGSIAQGILQPYLITCMDSKSKDLIPQTVSLVEKKCDTASNNLKVVFNQPEEDRKKDFAVCVKGLDFLTEDISIRLIEWIEVLRLLGADKLFIYVLQVHPNISKVLKHYSELGFVEISAMTLPGRQPNHPRVQHIFLKDFLFRKRQNELIPYNDCFYKNIHSYKFVVLLDVDEVIFPKRDLTWKSLMSKIINKNNQFGPVPVASYCARNVYFFDFWVDKYGWFKDIPQYMHMLQHVYRSGNYSRPIANVKCFHDSEIVLTLHNHFSLNCLNNSSCNSYDIDIEDAQLHHYRKDCRELKGCDEKYKQLSVMEPSVWKFKEPLVARTVDTMRTLGYF